MRLALTAAAAITPLRYIDNPVLLLEDGILAGVWARDQVEIPRQTRVLEYPGALLVPGFIDLHVHGGAGCDLMTATDEEFAAFERHLARHGVTSYCPTTLSAPVDATLSALERLADRIDQSENEGDGQGAGEYDELRSCPIGINLEGPFISSEKRGAHPREFIQPVSIELFERFWQAARGHIRLMTIAPELPGALELIAEASSRGVRVALGHSNADYATARAAVAAGARHATHVFNAMRGLNHRDPGLAAAVLNLPEVSAEIICDGVHVAPAMVELLLRAKGSEGAVLVSDAISAAGMPSGCYRLGSLAVQVEGDRCLSPEGRLAGSVLTLDQAVRNVIHFLPWGLESAVRLATINPARVLAVEFRRGSLVTAARADVVVLTPQGQVVETIVGGQVRPRG